MCPNNADAELFSDGGRCFLKANTERANEVLAEFVEPALRFGRVWLVPPDELEDAVERLSAEGLTVDPGDTGLAL